MLKPTLSLIALACAAPAFAHNIRCTASGVAVDIATGGYTSKVSIKSAANSSLKGYTAMILKAKTTESFYESSPSKHAFDIDLGYGAALELTFVGGSLRGTGAIQVNPSQPKVTLACAFLRN